MGETGKRRKGGLAMAVVCCVLAAMCLTGAAEAAAVQTRSVIPMGKAVGIKLFSDGVLVVGLSGVETEQGAQSPGKDCGLKAGDVITHINGSQVDTIEQVQDLLARQGQEPLTIQAVRSNRQMQLKAQAVENQEGVRQLGVWLRDSMAGIGTMTFYDPATGRFAALGHGINDTDTAILMPMEEGSIMPASVSEVKKGISGQPGELHGQFDMSADLGTLYANTQQGVFGMAEQLPLPEGAKPVEIAPKHQVKPGKASILSNVRGDCVEEFAVEILCVDADSEGCRNLMVQVTDEALIDLTGGIVQGMSGSPILQNGKIVGAVTHVLVNDPTRGYGIFIENMLAASS